MLHRRVELKEIRKPDVKGAVDVVLFTLEHRAGADLLHNVSQETEIRATFINGELDICDHWRQTRTLSTTSPRDFRSCAIRSCMPSLIPNSTDVEDDAQESGDRRTSRYVHII